MASHGSPEEGPGARNRAVLDAIEVGSCAKTFVVAAALEEAGCETTTPFYCGIKPGEEDPPVVRDDHGKPGWYSLMMVIAESRNTGTARIARVVGEERLYRFLSRFGFGRPTGIDLPSESSGVLRPVDQWSGRSLETVAIGYEFSATPLQLAMAYAAVANGGRLMRPRLVRAFVDAETGRSRDVKPEVVRRVVSVETSEELREVLRRVAMPGGTGTSANVVGTTIAGKTGTARKFDRERGTYSYERHTSSFIGFAPHDAPRYVVAVIIDEPRGAYYGSDVAAPVFRRVMEKVVALDPEGGRTDVRSLSVSLSDDASEVRPGDVHAAPATGSALECPDLRGLTTLEARRLAARRGYRLEVLGGGERVLFQEPVREGRLIVVETDDEVPRNLVVPDVRGLGLRDAITRLGGLGLDIERVGTGRVVRQTPEAGTEVSRGATIELELEDADRAWNVPGWSS
jgi:cell division protein FtsI (penicillin-binding protein 3)